MAALERPFSYVFSTIRITADLRQPQDMRRKKRERSARPKGPRKGAPVPASSSRKATKGSKARAPHEPHARSRPRAAKAKANGGGRPAVRRLAASPAVRHAQATFTKSRKRAAELPTVRGAVRRPPAWLEPALEAALEAIPTAAFLMDALGNVVLANARARALVAESEHDLVVLAVRGAQRGRRTRFVVTNIPAEGALVLAVQRPDPPTTEDLLLRAAARFGLTPAQGRVLGQLAEGKQNRSIASALGISERTVEAHVTALLEKIGVETRSAALAVALGKDDSAPD
jgi:DNA-binding CsgD family transcriptional regulator